MSKKFTTTVIAPASVAILLAGALGIGGIASAQDQDGRAGSPRYTTLDHPAKPCRLSVEAVANWGETSTHLPQACTYDRAAYTTLDHPARPCRLSVEAVANWGETSAHLPQACTYG